MLLAFARGNDNNARRAGTRRALTILLTASARRAIGRAQTVCRSIIAWPLAGAATITRLVVLAALVLPTFRRTGLG